MAKNSKSRSAKKRVKVQDLPTPVKTLTGKEAKQVKGGTKNVDIKQVEERHIAGVKYEDITVN